MRLTIHGPSVEKQGDGLHGVNESTAPDKERPLNSRKRAWQQVGLYLRDGIEIGIPMDQKIQKLYWADGEHGGHNNGRLEAKKINPKPRARYH